MKKILLTVLSLALLLSAFVFYTLRSTGYFKTIENNFDGIISQSINIPGAEDLSINYQANFLLISSTDRAAKRDGDTFTGGLYWADLNKDSIKTLLISQTFKPFYPHGISILPIDSNRTRVLAINHVDGQHSVEVFDLVDSTLQHIESLKSDWMINPNDLLITGPNTFYFTNDHKNIKGFGRFAEDFLGHAAANVIYYDGKDYREVASSIAYPNGINWDPDRNLLYVASSRDFLLKVYQIELDGDLTIIEHIDCKTGVDNIEIAPDGSLWIGCHPSLMTFADYAQGKISKSPSEIIRIDYKAKGDYDIEQIYLDDGTAMAAASVAAPYKDYIFLGNVMDDHFLVLKRN